MYVSIFLPFEPSNERVGRVCEHPSSVHHAVQNGARSLSLADLGLVDPLSAVNRFFVRKDDILVDAEIFYVESTTNKLQIRNKFKIFN